MKPIQMFVHALAMAGLFEVLWFGVTGSAQTTPTPLTTAPGVYRVDDAVKRGLTKAPESRGDFATTAISDWATGRVIALSFKTIETHTDHAHVLYILEGHAKFTIGKDTLEAGPGDVVVMPPNVAHKFEAMGDEAVKSLLVNVAGVS